MNHVGKIEFKIIDRISPSQFFSLKNCAYKSLLAKAFENKPLLPVSPNAYFGTVLHKILELISKGLVNSDNFDRIFNEQIRHEEDNLQKQGYSYFTPLQKNVKDFGIKKVLLKKHLKVETAQSSKVNGTKFQSEKWFESKDNLIAGKIDLVIENENFTEIIDFKTGAIKQDVLDDSGEIFSEVKEEYIEQLKLYAYLYFEDTGIFPTKLSIVDLTKQKFSIFASQSECNSIFEEAKALLAATNAGIDTGTFSANPTKINCKYCLYRPACSFFLKQIDIDFSFNDVTGKVKNVIKYQNGNVSAFLENGERKITITSFPSDKYDELFENLGKQICVYNLRKEATESVYSAIKTTKIYEYSLRK
jgi:CRISPR/Cas system-associated exonuclease Cas4 (RecB family)